MLVIFYGIGFITRHYELFPYKLIDNAFIVAKKVIFKQSAIGEKYYFPTRYKTSINTFDPSQTFPGPTLITSIGKDRYMSVKVINLDGTLNHEWIIDWFEIWPDRNDLTTEEKPKSRPGTHIHGCVILDNGDIVFNFEHLGLVRLDVRGRVVWTLDYRTHHSIYMDENNTLWVSGQINHTEPMPKYPNLKKVVEPTILNVSLDGEILNETSIVDLLAHNKLPGLLYMSATCNSSPKISGDFLHLNDVEVFPSSLPEGFFKAGDILVSLRNINSVFVFDGHDHHLKYKNIGGFVRQHDPDFIDGNSISVYDNHNVKDQNRKNQSRIVVHSIPDGHTRTHYVGSEAHPFYSVIMGKHQWLPNGNVLITDSMAGRAFEINSDGTIVWEYINIVKDGYIGIVEEATRISAKFSKDFFIKQQKNSN